MADFKITAASLTKFAGAARDLHVVEPPRPCPAIHIIVSGGKCPEIKTVLTVIRLPTMESHAGRVSVRPDQQSLKTIMCLRLRWISSGRHSQGT